LSARVEKINYLLGDAFKKGDVLISFDCELYKAQKEVIQSNYDSAKIQLENDKELLDMRSIGKLQYQLSVSALNKAKAELDIATLNVKRCKIIAPYDGKVMDVYTSIFTSIEQRQPLMDIVGDGLLEAEIVVPSNWLRWLKKDHPVKITIDETGETLDAKVISLGAAVDAVSQTIELKAQFNEKYETLIPGMSGIVEF
jgi:RND family efflux transporter MFP subunit